MQLDNFMNNSDSITAVTIERSLRGKRLSCRVVKRARIVIKRIVKSAIFSFEIPLVPTARCLSFSSYFIALKQMQY